MLMNLSRLNVALVIVASLAANSFGQEAQTTVNEKLHAALKPVADGISQFVKREEGDNPSVQLKRFDGPTNGAAIVQSLSKHLQEAGLKVLPTGANFSVSGDFQGERRDNLFMIRIEAKIKNPAGNTLHTLPPTVVSSVEESLALLGPSTVDLTQGAQDTATESTPPATTDTPPATTTPATTEGAAADPKLQEQPVVDEKVVADRLEEAATNPQQPTVVKPAADQVPAGQTPIDSIVKISPKSPYGLELWLKTPKGFQPALIELEGNRARVKIGADQVYAVRIYNNSDVPVGCDLRIDGISSFAFSQQYPPGQKMVIAPGKGGWIPGWHVNDAISHEFLITEYGKSAAGRLGTAKGVGTVTGVFYAMLGSKAEGNDPTPGSFATGVGQVTKVPYRRVGARFGAPLGAISIQYLRPDHPGDLPTADAPQGSPE